MNKCEFYLRKCLLKVKDNLLLWLYGEMKKGYPTIQFIGSNICDIVDLILYLWDLLHQYLL
jgi:hypothetical protein